jgi:hypothetical protein
MRLSKYGGDMNEEPAGKFSLESRAGSELYYASSTEMGEIKT